MHRHLKPVPTMETLRQVTPAEARRMIDGARGDLNWLLRLMSAPAHRLAVQQKLTILEAREREFLEDSTLSTEATP
jgi:hypothetical protein